MPGSQERHLDEFGMCQCGNPSGEIEMMVFEYQDERTRRWKTEKVPACADCFGLRG